MWCVSQSTVPGRSDLLSCEGFKPKIVGFLLLPEEEPSEQFSKFPTRVDSTKVQA